MSALAQQVINPVVTDPDNVPETYANGPININIMGPCATLTFTNVRPDIGQLMKGEQVTKHSAVVRVRVTLPNECLVGLKAALNQMIKDGAGPLTGPSPLTGSSPMAGHA